MDIVKRKSDYAIRALLCLGLAGDEAISCEQLSEACDIPCGFAHKIMKKLTNAGIVATRSGRRGGSQLARKPEAISLYEVIQTVQGPLSVSGCILGYADCSRRKRCPLACQWRKLQDRITGFLKRLTLDHLLTSFRHPVRPRRKKTGTLG